MYMFDYLLGGEGGQNLEKMATWFVYGTKLNPIYEFWLLLYPKPDIFNSTTRIQFLVPKPITTTTTRMHQNSIFEDEKK